MNISSKLIYIIPFVFLTTFGFTQTERWVYRYNGFGSGGDEAYCICYGGDGNIYAGGYTYNNTTNWDFTIISLTNSGSERWVYKYLTLGNNWDACHSICYGNDGNIYAIGDCTGSDSFRRFTIISLAPDGTERWVYQYPVLSSGKEICFGADGNIYAVGNTGGKILVVSVDSNGNERWHYIYNTPSSESDPGRSIVYGLDGNIYVVGYSGPVYNTDVTVISLTPSGSERWVYLYNGPGNTYDYGCYVIYASDGNLYIIGETDSTYNTYIFAKGLILSLTASGNERWTYISPNANPGGLYRGAYGADGNIYAAGSYGWDIPFFLVESVSDSGTYRWDYIDTTWGFACSIVYGDDGDIYVGGITTNNSTYEDYFSVISFTNSGLLRWFYRKHGWGNYNDIAYSVVYGFGGNVYAAGTIGDSVTGNDFTVISLSSTGIQEYNTVQDPASDGPKLNILPNIIHKNARIQYAIPERQRISLNLYDIVGRKITTIAKGLFEPGVYTVSHNFSEFNSGTYFLILEGEKEIRTQRILIVR